MCVKENNSDNNNGDDIPSPSLVCPASTSSGLMSHEECLNENIEKEVTKAIKPEEGSSSSNESISDAGNSEELELSELEELLDAGKLKAIHCVFQ